MRDDDPNESTADILRDVLDLADRVASSITDEEIERRYQSLLASVEDERTSAKEQSPE